MAIFVLKISAAVDELYSTISIHRIVFIEYRELGASKGPFPEGPFRTEILFRNSSKPVATSQQDEQNEQIRKKLNHNNIMSNELRMPSNDLCRLTKIE